MISNPPMKQMRISFLDSIAILSIMRYTKIPVFDGAIAVAYANVHGFAHPFFKLKEYGSFPIR